MVMYPEEFPRPKSSFELPVSAPDVDPDEPGEVVSLCFNAAWLPVVIGALQQLLLQSTWAGDDAAVHIALLRSQLLIDMAGARGEQPMCCDKIAECITTSENVQNALRAYLLSSGLLTGNSAGNSSPLSDLLAQIIASLGAGCSPSQRYGLAYKIVDVLNTITEDMLQIIVAITDEAEMAQALAANIPVVGQYVSTAIALAHWAVTNSVNLYFASYNEATHEQLACALYCDMAGNCELTADDILQTYFKILHQDVPPPVQGSWDGLVGWIATLTLALELRTVAVWHYILINVFVRGSSWLGLSTNSIAIGAQLAVPIVPPVECVCLTCNVWLGGTDNAEDWVIMPYNGQLGLYDAANDRFVAVWSTQYGSGKFIWVNFIYPSPVLLTDIYVGWDVNNTRSVSGVFQVWLDEISYFSDNSYPPNGTGQKHLAVTPPPTGVSSVWILLACRTWADDTDAHAYITRLELCDDGIA